MKRRTLYASLLISLLTLSSLFAQGGLPTKRVEGRDYYIYTVQPAEGFYSITRRFGVTEEMIRSANNLESRSLRSGEAILIPVATTGEVTAVASPVEQTKRVVSERVQAGYFIHTVEKKQTLSAISRLYGVSLDELEELNPGAREKLKAGRVLRIPKYEEVVQEATPQPESSQLRTHLIQSKETLYSVSRSYGVTVVALMEANPGLSPDTFSMGRTILIPESTTSPIVTPTAPDLPVRGDVVMPTRNSVNAVLFLPFQAANYNPRDVNQRRFVEYYEGLLMAIDSLKHRGFSVRLDVYDTQELDRQGRNYTTLPGVSDAQLIIGPTQNEQIRSVARFAAENRIPMLLPFTSRTEELESNPYLIQINTPQLQLYPEVVKQFVDRFRTQKVLFLREEGKKGDKVEFTRLLRDALSRSGVAFAEYSYSATDVELKAESLDPTASYIIVPESGSSESLKSFLPLLQLYKKAHPTAAVSLFGYPEWQTFVRDYLEAFYLLDTYIYSSFYADNNSGSLNAFYHSYKQWYRKDVMNSYPKFGALGFDTGLYFLQQVAAYNGESMGRIQRGSYDGLQSGFRMTPANNRGGLINQNIYWIRYTPDFDIIKLSNPN